MYRNILREANEQSKQILFGQKYDNSALYTWLCSSYWNLLDPIRGPKQVKYWGSLRRWRLWPLQTGC